MRLIALFVLLGSSLSFGAESKDVMAFKFNGTDYFHRWSKSGQNEFTPKGQEDLDHWVDMVTINVHENVADGDQLAAVANKVLGNYQATKGTIVKTDSKPATKDTPAEHFAAVVLPSPDFLEAALARFLISEGRGLVIVYSHRIYGRSAGNAMSAWLTPRGPDIEKVLRAWAEIPTLAQLRALPQSE